NEPETERPGVIVHVPRRVARDAGDMVDPVQPHRAYGNDTRSTRGEHGGRGDGGGVHDRRAEEGRRGVRRALRRRRTELRHVGELSRSKEPAPCGAWRMDGSPRSEQTGSWNE